MLAGPAATVVFAIAVICVVLMIGDDHPIAEVGLVRPDTPADQAGFEAGDEIERWGVEVETWNQAMAFFSYRPAPPAAIRRDGEPLELSVMSMTRQKQVETAVLPTACNHGPCRSWGWMTRPPAGAAGPRGWLVKKVNGAEVRDWVASTVHSEHSGMQTVDIEVGVPDLQPVHGAMDPHLERGAWTAPQALGPMRLRSGDLPAVPFSRSPTRPRQPWIRVPVPAAPPRDCRHGSLA